MDFHFFRTLHSVTSVLPWLTLLLTSLPLSQPPFTNPCATLIARFCRAELAHHPKPLLHPQLSFCRQRLYSSKAQRKRAKVTRPNVWSSATIFPVSPVYSEGLAQSICVVHYSSLARPIV